jgi:hypothetical protein
MKLLKITYVDGETESHDVDSVQFNEAGTFMNLRRARYNGGVQDTVKTIYLASVRSWEWV